MTTFDSTKASLNDLLREIREGKIQLPDFQRGWVWDDDHIRDLLVSIARSFPIGAVMLLEAGGEVRFQTRPVEGLEGRIPPNRTPEKLILDGQQRLTTLTQALSLEAPVNTQTAKGMDALLASHALEPALLRSDDFDRFVEDRRRRLVALIERAMGKQVILSEEKEEYEMAEAESFID